MLPLSFPSISGINGARPAGVWRGCDILPVHHERLPLGHHQVIDRPRLLSQKLLNFPQLVLFAAVERLLKRSTASLSAPQICKYITSTVSSAAPHLLETSHLRLRPFAPPRIETFHMEKIHDWQTDLGRAGHL